MRDSGSHWPSCRISRKKINMAKRSYRLSLDDNIWFLQDIAQHADIYRSLFDNPYLGMYRAIHEQFGTKVHVNIYEECPEFGGFHLSQMPDRFKKEWQANADWLRLSFHAKANLPPRPYLTAEYDQVKSDCQRVMQEIRRFAGDAALAKVTTLHFAEATKEGVRALRDCGFKALLGTFMLNKDGQHKGAYYLNRAQVDQIHRDSFYTDPETQMIFFAYDIVLNMFKPMEIGPELDRMAALYPNRDFIDILIHEQYFYPHYVAYLPDYRQRVLAGIQWCVSRGFEPAFAGDLLGL